MTWLSDLLSALFASTPYMPHGYCYLWRPGLVWLHGSTDALIGASYVSISLSLWGLVRRIRLPFSPIILAFGAFILACGFTHLVEVWTLWTPAYWLSGGLKALTAAASVATGLLLYPVKPRVARLAEDAALSEARRVELEQKNAELNQLYGRMETVSEERLRESEERFRATFEQAAVGIAHVALDGRWLRMNRRYCELLGYTPEELQAKTFEELTPPDDLDGDLAQLKELAEGRLSTYAREKRYLRKDGTIVWVQLTVSLVHKPGGEPDYFIAVVEDIGAHKAAEAALRAAEQQAREAVKLRDEFLSVAAHELKTPLTALKLHLSLFERTARLREATQELVERMETIGRQVERLNTLTSSLLDVSRLSAPAAMDLELEEVDLGELVGNVVEQMQPALARAGCDVRLDLELGLHASVNPVRMEQVLTNLLSNAVKYGAGSPVEVRLHREDGRVSLEVTDRGIGIAADALDRIFRKFERAVPVANYGGLGLGLFISRQLVEAMGGTIDVVSAPGQGATFTVRLPLSGE